jgi:hypothetical protein
LLHYGAFTLTVAAIKLPVADPEAIKFIAMRVLANKPVTDGVPRTRTLGEYVQTCAGAAFVGGIL